METNCKFTDGFGLQYTCTVNDVEEPISSIEKFIGNHHLGKTDADVKVISFDRCKFESFPRGLQKQFPQFTHLFMENCELKQISRLELVGLENLICLSLINCGLTSLPDNLFLNMRKMRGISFRENKIEFVSSKLLHPLIGRSNVVVSFKGNKAIDAQFFPGAVSSLKSLEELMEMIDKQCKKPVLPNEMVNVNGHEDLTEKLKDLWTSGRFSDFKVIAGAKEFKVHKTILGMQSPVLAKIIEEHNEATELKIIDFTSEAAESLLHFVYTGEIKGEENAIENFTIADKFQIAKMKAAYEDILTNQLNNYNAYDFFLLAHHHSAVYLKEKAFTAIASKFSDKLPEELMQNPEKLKKLIDIRLEYESLLGK